MAMDFKKKNLVRLSDTVGVEDAEKLLEWLQGKPAVKVDLSACTHIHTSNIQVLMAAQVAVTSWPADAELARWLQTALKANP
jgi:anti-anti-sigma regulatory factor